jgi:hypothetical protein
MSTTDPAALLVGMVGIEPTTPVLSGQYSTSELHASKIGAPYGNRTRLSGLKGQHPIR